MIVNATVSRTVDGMIQRHLEETVGYTLFTPDPYDLDPHTLPQEGGLYDAEV